MIVQLRVSEINARLATVLADRAFLAASETKLAEFIPECCIYVEESTSSTAQPTDYATRSGVATKDVWLEWERQFGISRGAGHFAMRGLR